MTLKSRARTTSPSVDVAINLLTKSGGILDLSIPAFVSQIDVDRPENSAYAIRFAGERASGNASETQEGLLSRTPTLRVRRDFDAPTWTSDGGRRVRMWPLPHAILRLLPHRG